MVRIARCLLKSQKFMHVLRFCWVLVMLMVKGQFVTPTPNNGNLIMLVNLTILLNLNVFMIGLFDFLSVSGEWLT